MIIFALLSLLSALIVFFLGVFVFAKDTKNSLNILFMLFSISFALIGIAEYGMRQAQTYEFAYFWSKIAILLVLPITFLFHFSLIFSKRIKLTNRKYLFLIYIPVIFFILISLTTGILDKPPVLKYWGWTYGPPKPSVLLLIYNIWEQILVILTFFLLILNYFTTKIGYEKKQAKLFLLGFLLALIIFLIFDYFNLDLFGYDLPEFGIIGFTISSVFIAYAINKYHLFKLNINTASDNIIKNLSDSLILTTLKGEIISTNQATAKILKYDKNELKGLNVNEIINSKKSQDYKLLKDFISPNYEKYNIKDIEITYKRKDRINVPVSLSLSLIDDPNLKQPEGIIFIARDITKRKNVERQHKKLLSKQKKYIDEILKSSKFKTQFISSMSHELRTPLNSIIGFTDLLLEGSYGSLNKDQVEFLKNIKSSSEHLLHLINELLDLSKIESGNLEIQPQEIKLNNLIRVIRTKIEPLTEEKNLSLEFAGFDNYQSIFADPVRLREIFYNLLTNAVKYTDKGGIDVKFEKKPKFWLFSISDTGIGIDRKNYDCIFQEFDRTDNPIIKEKDGTGLGLPLTRRLVNLHGGKIWFKSKVNQGTTFYFSLPRELKI